MKQIIYIFILLQVSVFCSAQELEIQVLFPTDISLRGIDVIDDSMFVVSGSSSYIGYSDNGGKSIVEISPKTLTYNTKDIFQTDIQFRDIEALHDTVFMAMSITKPACIIRSEDKGKNWEVVMYEKDSLAFFDSMDCDADGTCVLLGDPLSEYPYIAISEDKGKNWKKFPKRKLSDYFLPLTEGEAFFAASGTNVVLKDSLLWYASGGSRSQFYLGGNETFQFSIPMIQGKETTGANSLAIHPSKPKGIIVGGDFLDKENTFQNCVVFQWNEKSKEFVFSTPKQAPNGYRSCVAMQENLSISCGLNGVDISYDDGITWEKISKHGFHSIAFSPSGKMAYAVGNTGYIGILKIE